LRKWRGTKKSEKVSPRPALRIRSSGGQFLELEGVPLRFDDHDVTFSRRRDVASWSVVVIVAAAVVVGNLVIGVVAEAEKELSPWIKLFCSSHLSSTHIFQGILFQSSFVYPQISKYSVPDIFRLPTHFKMFCSRHISSSHRFLLTAKGGHAVAQS
jgi:hypothetical protein